VTPSLSAVRTARSEGAPTAARIGSPATAALATSSKPMRPESTPIRWWSGRLPGAGRAHRSRRPGRCGDRRPRARSTVRPARSNRPVACSPPVVANSGCAARRRSGSDATSDHGTGAPSGTVVGTGGQRAASSSIDARPQTPHEAVAAGPAFGRGPEVEGAGEPGGDPCPRVGPRGGRRPASAAPPGRPRDRSSPSLTSQPRTRSISWPGVRRVVRTGTGSWPGPAASSSSGSSLTSRSEVSRGWLARIGRWARRSAGGGRDRSRPEAGRRRQRRRRGCRGRSPSLRRGRAGARPPRPARRSTRWSGGPAHAFPPRKSVRSVAAASLR
jgi:hypothetical protein